MKTKKWKYTSCQKKKRELARQLKEYEGEGSFEGRKNKKKHGEEYYSIFTEEYQMALADAEKNRQETLKFQMANNRNKAKAKELGNQFKGAMLELEAKEAQMIEVMKENARLQEKIREMEDAPVPIPFPECKECDRFLEQCVPGRTTISEGRGD